MRRHSGEAADGIHTYRRRGEKDVSSRAIVRCVVRYTTCVRSWKDPALSRR